MCRMSWLSNEVLGKLSDETLLEFFNQLEDSCGGHGNGVGGYVDGKPLIQKGVDFTNIQAIEFIRGHKWDNGVIYHTRIASSGTICNHSCHPFHNGMYVTSHNGTWGEYKKYVLPLVMMGKLPVKYVDKITDSEVIAAIVGRGFKLSEVIDNGTILSLGQRGVRVFVSGRNWEAFKFEDGTYIYASEVKYFEQKAFAGVALEFRDGRYTLHSDKIKSITGGVIEVKTQVKELDYSNYMQSTLPLHVPCIQSTPYYKAEWERTINPQNSIHPGDIRCPCGAIFDKEMFEAHKKICPEWKENNDDYHPITGKSIVRRHEYPGYY